MPPVFPAAAKAMQHRLLCCPAHRPDSTVNPLRPLQRAAPPRPHPSHSLTTKPMHQHEGQPAPLCRRKSCVLCCNCQPAQQREVRVHLVAPSGTGWAAGVCAGTTALTRAHADDKVMRAMAACGDSTAKKTACLSKPRIRCGSCQQPCWGAGCSRMTHARPCAQHEQQHSNCCRTLTHAQRAHMRTRTTSLNQRTPTTAAASRFAARALPPGHCAADQT